MLASLGVKLKYNGTKTLAKRKKMPFICTTIHMVHPVLCICALGTYNRRLQR